MNDELRCLVCGYELGFEPWSGDSPSDEICPCCGVQFGYDDQVARGRREHPLYAQLRAGWIERGMKWWSVSRAAPAEWDPAQQLASFAGE